MGTTRVLRSAPPPCAGQAPPTLGAMKP